MIIAGIFLSTVFAPVPKLTVVISIDQFRRDYVSRYSKYYRAASSKEGVGGFQFLTEKGANFINSRYSHVQTMTGPGHAVIGTGSNPALDGIVDNVWFDRSTKKTMYCVQDDTETDILTGKKSMSPRNQLTTTFADELKMATNGKGKAVSLALKDRAAILMIGHTPDSCVWYDRSSGDWTTSTYFAPNKQLPSWTSKINSKNAPANFDGKSWNSKLTSDQLALCVPPKSAGKRGNFGLTFPHSLGKVSDKSVFDLWTYTPYANRYVLDSAVTAINENQLGADDIPDVLTINLSSNDYLGHAFGPYSPEVMQMSIETDEALSDFFRTLDAKIGLKNVAIAVTADHGVLPLAEDLTAQRIPSGRVDPGELFKKVNEKLESQFKVADLLMKGSTNEFMVYVDHELCNAHNLNLQTVIQAAKTELLQNKAVYRVFTSSDLESNQLSADILSQSTLASYRTDRSGDLIYFLRPGLLAGDGNTGTSHGTPWTYDQNVPLLFWVPGMSPGTYTDAAGPQDIAATLCHAMGIGEPNGSVGRILGKW